MNKLLNDIKEAETILIMGHESSDSDCLGSTFGLGTCIKDNFPEKNIKILNDIYNEPFAKIFPLIITESIDLQNLSPEKTLIIVCDTANLARVGYKAIDLSNFSIIKIDHHPIVETYGKRQYVNSDASSCCEVITELLLEMKLTISSLAAKYLYTGIVGDSGRFRFPSTSDRTLYVASILLKTGFNVQKEVYQPLYLKDIKDLKVRGYLMSHCVVTDEGVGYFILSKETQDLLEISNEGAKQYLSIFSEISQIKIWACFVEDVEKGLWKVSIRSRETKINEVAALHRGGGHAFASGAKANNKEEIDCIVKELSALLK